MKKKDIPLGTRDKDRDGMLKAVLESIKDFIFLLDSDMVFREYFQPASENLLKDPRDFIGKHIEDIGFPEPALSGIKKSVEETIETGEDSRAEYCLDLPNGRRWYDLRASVFKNSSGEKAGAVCVVRDITDTHRLKSRLERNRNQLSATLLSIGDGVITADHEGRVSVLNAVAEKLTGWTQTEAEGKRVEEVFNIIKSETGEKSENPVGKALRECVTVGLENDTVLISLDGSKHYIEDSCAPIRTKEGEILGAVLVFRDVSEEYRRKEQEKFELRFQETVSRTSDRFLTISEEDFDRAVEDALSDFGSLFGVDRGYVFRFYEDGKFMDNTHEWCAEGIEPQKDRISGMPTDNLPWYKEKIMELKPVHIPNVKKLPDEAEAEKKEFLAQGIQSLICLPMRSSIGIIKGFMGFDSVKQPYGWSEKQLRMLMVIAEIISGAFNRRETLLSLKESRARYKSLVINIPGAAYRCLPDKKWSMIYIGDEIESLSGYPAEDFINNRKRSYASIIHRDDAVNVDKAINRAVSENKPWELEYRILSSAGETRWVYEKGRGVREGGETVFLDGFIYDITDRKHAEERVKQLVSEQELLLANIDVMVWYLMDHETYGAVNRAYAGFLGMDKKDIEHRNIRDVLSKEKADMCLEGNMKVFETGEKDFSEFRVKDTEEEERVISVTKIPKLDREGKVEYVVCSGIDVTHQRRAQEEMERAMKAREGFISMVSHELRTPLTVIIEGVNIVADGSCGEVNPEQEKFLNLARKNVDRLGRLINDILDIQKMEEGMMKYEIRENSIIETLLSAAEASRPVAEKKGLALETDIEKGLPEVSFDRDKISQVLNNLLNNALKFTEKGSITLAAALEDDNIKVSVSDTGPGISPEDMPRLFGKFEQFKINKQRTTGGTGLGLAICREIITRHGGRIWAESEPGTGTVFYFTFPVKQEGDLNE